MRTTDELPAFRPRADSLKPAALLPALLLPAALMLGACTPDRGVHQDDAYQCLVPDSPACAAARASFQVVRYPTFPADQLVVASSRALGDLNFEAERDDAHRQVSGQYVASAPTHEKQLDSQFAKNLKRYAKTAVSAQVEILPQADHDTGADVRLRLYYLPDGSPDGTAPQLIDSVAPYQIFFSQLGIELGAPAAPPPKDERPQDRRHPVVPSISGV